MIVEELIAFGTVALMTWFDHKRGMRWRRCLIFNFFVMLGLQILIHMAEEMTK